MGEANKLAITGRRRSRNKAISDWKAVQKLVINRMSERFRGVGDARGRREEMNQVRESERKEWKARLLVGLRAEGADGLADAPHLLLANLLELNLEVLAVGLATVELERPAGLGSVTDRLVELLEHGLVGGVELGGPVEGTATGSGGAGLREERKRSVDERGGLKRPGTLTSYM